MHERFKHEQFKHRPFRDAGAGGGQAIQVWVGPTYRTISVCNDTTSKGTVTVTIDSRGSDVLAPSLCTENSGSSISLVNDPDGPALIVYRSQTSPGFLRD